MVGCTRTKSDRTLRLHLFSIVPNPSRVRPHSCSLILSMMGLVFTGAVELIEITYIIQERLLWLSPTPTVLFVAVRRAI
jgi:hypothetical protein